MKFSRHILIECTETVVFGSLILTMYTLTMPVMDIIYSEGIIVDPLGLPVAIETI